MNDEIKEILSNDNIHIIECDKNWCNAYGYEKSQLKVDLLDYITNLQEEKEDYKSRCEKANKFIKEKISSTQGVINDYMYHKEHNKILIELLQEDIEMYKKELNILNGGDEE